MRRLATCLLLVGAIGLTPQPASAHGELESTEPRAGATVKNSPKHVYINLTEAPSRGAVVRVRDGCGDEVPLELVTVERTLHATLSEGTSGKWQVDYRAISKVDGHATKEAFSFTVRGQKDCSEVEAPDTANDQEPDATAEGNDDSDEASGGAVGSGTFVIVLVGIGALMLLGILWTVRSIFLKRGD